MVKQTIQIFARIKPTKAKLGLYELDQQDDGSGLLNFTVPRELASGFINNKKETYKFRFEKVFDQKTKQDEIFDNVAKPVIDNVLAGYNGTIFAYGQTGSGKTFTITGGPEKYSDRGIIPRTLSYIFEYFQQNPENEYTTHVSYLEIYNENGYDLLDPKKEASKLEDLPKVTLMEDSDCNIHLRNLSTHQARGEEEALNLLFTGDTNRMIAETPMNQASTRSHCVFTVHVTSRETGSATIRRAKLHLVDLAGSERVAKSGVNGLLLTEAKYINLSLHYLEQVIVSLSEKNRQHIPYRNSMMTSMLRDSLGGNCMTTMIATCSVEKKNVDESISTCRFAQRVALIKNDAILNEELDPKLMIQKLKREIAQLKEELAMATGEQRTDALSEEDLERCREAVKRYLEDTDPECSIDIGADMRKIQECFKLLKREVLERERAPPQSAREEEPEQEGEADPRLVKKLKDTIMQRDNEINILVNMLKKEKKRAAEAIKNGGSASYTENDSTLSNGHHNSGSTTNWDSVGHGEGHHQGQGHRPPSSRRNRGNTPKTAEMEEKAKNKILGELSTGRQEAYEIFKRDYEHNETIENNKAVLKQRYAEAKQLGEQVNKAKAKITKLKGSIEQHRMSMVMQGLVNPENPESDEMEMEMRRQIEEEKSRYKDTVNRLKHLKTEIEHLQHLLEKSKMKLMKDFELWWAEQAASAQEQQAHIKNLPPVKAKSAWRTPPVSPNVSNQSEPIGHVSSATSSRTSLASSSSAPIPAHIHNSLAGGSTRHRGSEGGTSGYSSRESTASNKQRFAGETGGNAIPLTGDAQADADIMAFLRARQNIMKHAQSGGQR